MGRQALTDNGDARRQRITQPQPVGKGTKGVQPDVGHHLLAAPFHPDARRAVSVHLGSALLFGYLRVSTTAVSFAGGPFRGPLPLVSGYLVKGRG